MTLTHPVRTADEMVAIARQRAIDNGMPPDRATSGPFAEMLLSRGVSPERTARAVWFFTHHLHADMVGVVGQATLDEFAMTSAAAIQRAGGEIVFQVLVVGTAKGEATTPRTEHLVEVLAHDHHEAELIASALAGCRQVRRENDEPQFDDEGDPIPEFFEPMPLSTRTITDSTLCVL